MRDAIKEAHVGIDLLAFSTFYTVRTALILLLFLFYLSPSLLSAHFLPFVSFTSTLPHGALHRSPYSPQKRRVVLSYPHHDSSSQAICYQHLYYRVLTLLLQQLLDRCCLHPVLRSSSRRRPVPVEAVGWSLVGYLGWYLVGYPQRGVGQLSYPNLATTNGLLAPHGDLPIDFMITHSGTTLITVVSTSSSPVILGTSQDTITANLAMTTNVDDLMYFVKTQVEEITLDTGSLDGLLALKDSANPGAGLLNGFNIVNLGILTVYGLVNITMTTSVKADDYRITMAYIRTDADTTDQIILKVIPFASTLTAQLLVKG